MITVNTAISAQESVADLPALHLDLLQLPQGMTGTLYQMLDVLQMARRIAQIQQKKSLNLSWQWLSGSASAVTTIATSSSLPPEGIAAGALRVLVIPGLFVANAVDLWTVPTLYPWIEAYLNDYLQRGGRLALCFNSLVFPAAMGRLNGQEFCVHWALQAGFRQRVPEAVFSASEPVSLNAPFYYCAVSADIIDFSLRLLSLHWNADIATACRQLLFFNSNRQQHIGGMLEAQWLGRTADSPVYRAMVYIHDHMQDTYSLKKLAEVARSSERTLLRHFQQVLNKSPLEYLQQLRIERACIMLEITIDTVQTIATACGIADVNFFRRLFVRHVGMSPAEYRKRLTLRSGRSRWRLEHEGNSVKGAGDGQG